MKPVIIVPPATLSDADIQDPGVVKFLDPIPATIGRDKIENAAIALARKLLAPAMGWPRSADGTRHEALYPKDVAALFVEILTLGTPLDGRLADLDREFVAEKRSETRKIAREEVRAERAAAKAKKEEPQS